jgi:negative regulator of flagellin synthesis FlgM
MEISNKVPPVQSTANAGGPAGVKDPSPAGAASKGDRVNLSAKAQELQSAREAIRNMDDIDHEKVAGIKAQIEAGTYKVDGQKVARKMLEESLLKDLEM